MNHLSVVLWEGMIHATGFALVGILVYLALRRWSPAAGSLGAAATLLLMAILSVLAFCPWPRWRIGDTLDTLRTAALASTPAHQTDGGASGPISAPGVTSQPSATPSPAPDRPSMALALLEVLSESWGGGSAVENQDRWSWSRWFAGMLAASMVLGLARLATGLWAVRRMRLRSEPLDDPSLLDLIEILRAETGCRKHVEVRVSRDLATPATIGWRRTLVLLPRDWSEWNADERRAVLAHELAHVCRGDYFVGLLAQLSVALQFYHPLAHWLSARLRLEQELAADAWSARLSGGTSAYIHTIARMALRRDDQAISWPARAFLPSRGTFVRRIEMLRNQRTIRHVWLSSPARFLTIGFLAAIGLLIAGLRGPLSPSPALAQDQPKPVAGAAAGVPEKRDFDLKYLPAETRILIACRPAAALSRPELAPAAALLTDLPIPAQEIEQLLIFWEGSPETPGQPGRAPIVVQPSGLIIRSVKPQDWKNALGFIPRAEEATHAGQTYLRAEGGSPRHVISMMSAYFPDNRTAVCAREDLLRTMIEDRNAPPAQHVWDDAWKQAAKGYAGLALDVRWLRRRLNQGNMKLDTIAPLLEKVRAYAVGVDLDKGLAVDIVARVGSPDDVKPVTDTAQALLTLGRNSIPGLKEQHQKDREPLREANDRLFGVAATLLEKARLESAGSTIHLRSSAPLELASRVLNSSIKVAAAASRRKVAANHLKQIGLAFSNYHDVHKHLPPPVLYGGKSGKVPYSWRVAILPFLAEQDLYNAYNFDEPWDGPNNRKLLDRMPAIYSYSEPGAANPTHPAFFVFTGPDTLLGKGDKPQLADVTDGTSNTILAVEAKREIPWTKPEDILFDPHGPLPELGGFAPAGFNALFCDGSARHLNKSINPATLRALITRAGREVIPDDLSR